MVRYRWASELSNIRILGVGSGTFRALHRPEAPSFGRFGVLGEFGRRWDWRRRSLPLPQRFEVAIPSPDLRVRLDRVVPGLRELEVGTDREIGQGDGAAAKPLAALEVII